jgi:uncharacterized YccA/Bax inhibitor family protein
MKKQTEDKIFNIISTILIILMGLVIIWYFVGGAYIIQGLENPGTFPKHFSLFCVWY